MEWQGVRCGGILAAATISDTLQLRRFLPLLALLAAPALAHGESLTDAEKKVIEARVEKLVPYRAKLAVSPGETIFIEKSKLVKKVRIRKKPTDYEGVVTGIVAPRGVVVHPRLDEFRLEPQGNKIKVTLRYAIHVDPGSKGGGRVRLTAKLIERTGLASTAAQIKIKHWIKIGPPATPSIRDLAADFHAYRRYGALAQARRARLAKARFKLSMKDLARPPPMDRLKGRGVAEVYAFLKERRRMWIAHRHLIAASQGPNPRLKKAANAYLANLGKKPGQMKGLPKVALVDEPKPPPKEEAEVETLQPTAVEPAPGTSGEEGSLAPVASYEPGSESDYSPDLPESSRPRPANEPPPAPAEVVKPGEQTASPGETTEEETLVLSDDPFAKRQLRKIVYIPGYNRSLVLDDPNIAHGAAIRMAWANVRFQESAVASAFFFHGQVALTRSVGVEATLPMEYVDVDLDETRSVVTLGNPLVAAKYRLYLPKVLGRRPALTLRGRWAIPISPIHNIPPTDLLAENFTREAHFSDTYAFFLEKTALGLGLQLAWQWEFLYTGVQLYSDYFFPVEGAADQTDFFTLSYGFSVGALPFGDIVGAYVEGRATSLLAGPRRTEFFMYFGVRGRLMEYIEPGLWVGVPLGSVADVSGVQIGAELRFSYDLADILDTGTFTRQDGPLVE